MSSMGTSGGLPSGEGEDGIRLYGLVGPNRGVLAADDMAELRTKFARRKVKNADVMSVMMSQIGGSQCFAANGSGGMNYLRTISMIAIVPI